MTNVCNQQFWSGAKYFQQFSCFVIADMFVVLRAFFVWDFLQVRASCVSANYIALLSACCSGLYVPTCRVHYPTSYQRSKQTRFISIVFQRLEFLCAQIVKKLLWFRVSVYIKPLRPFTSTQGAPQVPLSGEKSTAVPHQQGKHVYTLSSKYTRSKDSPGTRSRYISSVCKSPHPTPPHPCIG